MKFLRHNAAGWMLAAGYSFLAIAGHGGLHALSGDEHAHCLGVSGAGRHAHIHRTSDGGESSASHAHACHGHHHHGGHNAPHEDTPQPPLPAEHDDDCLICVVLSHPVEVTAPVTFTLLDAMVGEAAASAVVAVEIARLPTPPVRGPPLA